ncbi:MAB_1171c family putative transporter [Streptomyces sioyaensis]|uniref:MAB_1171c family putative transporter n=1 Tax=Streptomyces sioyaensis TaxID=67364 RepID=UPI0037D64B47
MAMASFAVFLTGLVATVAWKLYQLARDPRNAPLRAVTLCLVCLLASYAVAMPAAGAALGAGAHSNAGKLAQNILLLATAYFLMCFYLRSAADGPAGRRRARWESIPVLAVMATIAAAVLTAPRDADFSSYAGAHMTIPQVAVFYLVAGLYLVYALASSCWWTRRYARMSRRPQSTGLWLAAAGLLGMAGASAVRAVFVVVRWCGGRVPSPLNLVAALVLVLSIPLFVVGVSYPGARARISIWQISRHHRRVYRQLRPLWTLLSEACPDTVLRPASASWRDRWMARGVHRRYHRRIVECRDGLVQISPYLHAPNAKGSGSVLELEPSETLAEHVRRAVQARKQGVPAPGRPIPLAVPQGDNRDADVRQLVALSNALRTRSSTTARESESTC